MIYSPDLLRLMGTKITADILAENHVNNEQKLWRHVILNAFEDCRIEAGDRKSALNKTDAHFWIARFKDFDQICWWAGWEPDDVRFRYYKAHVSHAQPFLFLQQIGESVGVHASDEVASRLAEDTDFRLREVVQVDTCRPVTLCCARTTVKRTGRDASQGAHRTVGRAI